MYFSKKRLIGRLNQKLSPSRLRIVMLFGIACFSPIQASAESVGAASCATPGVGLSTGSVSCSAIGSYGYANAWNSVTVGQAGILATADASALLQGIRGIASESTAQVSDATAIRFDTSGPLRNGYLDLTLQQTIWSQIGYGSASELLTVGSYSTSLNGQDLSLMIPIQLGTPFAFDFQQSITANGDAGSGPAMGALSADISLQAFEADQITAVDLLGPTPDSQAASDAPEPATLGMMGFATLSSIFLIHLFRRPAKVGL